MRARWAWLFVTLLAGLGATPDLQTASPRHVVIGYLFPQDRLLDPAQIAADKLTHINYAFANLRDGQVVEGFARDAENFEALAAVRRTHPHLKLLVSVGGWTWSKGFSDAVLTPEQPSAVRGKRRRFRATTRSRRVRRRLGVPRPTRRRQHAPTGRQDQFHRR